MFIFCSSCSIRSGRDVLEKFLIDRLGEDCLVLDDIQSVYHFESKKERLDKSGNSNDCCNKLTDE